MKIRSLFLSLICFCTALTVQAIHQPQFSTAGFYALPESGRDVYNMNVAWRFLKSAAQGASDKAFDDTQWSVVSLPHGIEYLPTEASGCTNYQGEVWYRKHFTPADSLKGKKLFIHFEAIMGKSKIWVNGKLVKEHFGGYLPIAVDITDALAWGEDNVIAVWADNSDDPMYPPGKAQDVLDFAYFGGIYRDCWLVAHNDVYITDPNVENSVAGGGLFVSYRNVSESAAEVALDVQLRNASAKGFAGVVTFDLQQADGKTVVSSSQKVGVKGNKLHTASKVLKLSKPNLWSPESPYLYNLIVTVKDKKGQAVDGYRRRIGIRSIEFKGIDGFWLNGKPYEKPLMGANRHQDYAVVGNAVANSAHWRDAKKLRDAGMKIIRNAHCPQDPAFLDACDELGLFVINNTPGWQFWNKAPIFEQRVYSDIRNLVRRDRNHPCIWLWEPILNETWYPADFAKNTKDIVDEEYPHPYCYSASDKEARGSEEFSVLFTHPVTSDPDWAIKELDPKITYFTREWGDNVDDWNSHNSISRTNRSWGETPMLIQAQHYAKPAYKYTSYDALFRTTRQHVGGTLWHAFDHQRGYHPDPFYGGVMDVFRQPKYSYYLFMAQREPVKSDLIAETGPMVRIAHEMTPFSPKDVTVYSNCDEVRLTVFKDGKQYTYNKAVQAEGMPSPVITFKDAYNFMDDKALSRKRKQADVYMLAEGLMDGKVVTTHQVMPARRPSKIVLWIDNEGTALKADGSDFVTVVAGIADKAGNIKRLNNYSVRFHIEGEGRILGGASVQANPRPVSWGTAPILVQSTTQPGKIKITASVLFEGSQMPISGELELSSVAPSNRMLYSANELKSLATKEEIQTTTQPKSDLARELEQVKQELNALKLKEVERQQTDFGEKTK